jgi:membrane-associated phospholipid phosphatase
LAAPFAILYSLVEDNRSHGQEDSPLMSRSATPDSQAAQPYRSAPPGPGSQVSRVALPRLVTGVTLSLVVLLLGLLAKTGPVARLNLRADQHIAADDRTGWLTAVAKAATTIATPETVGTGLMIVVPVILLLARRRLDAVKVFCMFAGAFTMAEAGKRLIGEHRPPASLQLVAADSGASFPSGHAAAAAMLAVALVVIAATPAGRAAAVGLGGLYAVAVAASRVYLGDHYPVDVLGSMLCALAAAFIVTGLAALPAVQPWFRRLQLTTPGGRHR